MKKIIRAIVLSLLAVMVALSATACTEGKNWKGTSIKNWGDVVSNNGFIAETQNNVYFINGIGASTADNTFGQVVQGSLMGISKADLISGDLEKAEIVIPKLFTARDYKSGLYISGDYVYYGTPSTQKNSQGEIANNEMVITKTKLDGTKSESILTLPSNSTEYRITEKDGQISIVYYDTADKAIKVFANGKTTTVIKTDVKTNENAFGNGYESLNAYTFLKGNGLNGNTVIFNTIVYSEEYFAEKEENTTSYSREQYLYNNIYVLKAGETTPELVIDGSEKGVKTDILYNGETYLFYKQTAIEGDTAIFGAVAKDFSSANLGQKINDGAEEYLTDATLIQDLDNAYVVDLEQDSEGGTITGGNVYKTTLVGDEKQVKQKVILSETIRDLLFINNGYAYFLNEDSQIARIEINKEDAKEQRVSTDIVSTSWYEPKVLNLSGKDYLFYVDASKLGCSYLRVINLTDATLVEEDTDDDEENDLFYLSGNEFIAQKTNSHKAVEFTFALDNALEGSTIKYEEVQGEIVFTELDKATAIYNSLSEDVKDEISSDYKTKHDNMIKAAALAQKYYALRDIKIVANTETLREAFESAKALKTEIINSKKYSLQTIVGYIENNLKYYYQEAEDIFAEAE